MTTIKEEKIPHLDNNPPKFKRHLYPVPLHENIQRPYFVCCAIGQRGSGKTYSITRLLLNQEKSGFIDPITGEKVAIRHFLFSPTYAGNPVFTALKYLDDDDIINEYTESKLQEVLDELKEEREKTEDYQKYVEAFKKFEKMTKKEFEKWTDIDAIMLLESNDFCHYRELEKPKYPNGVVANIILDDCLGGEAFNAKRKSLLVKAILNSRHYGINVLIASQNMKAINKSIRANTDVWILFRFKSQTIILQDIYEEISGVLTPEQFLSIYEYATLEDNNALVIDAKEKDKNNMFKKNLDVILRFATTPTNNINTSNISP